MHSFNQKNQMKPTDIVISSKGNKLPAVEFGLPQEKGISPHTPHQRRSASWIAEEKAYSNRFHGIKITRLEIRSCSHSFIQNNS